MGLSYRNILNGEQLTGALGSGDFSLTDSFKKKATNSVRYIKGYAQDSAIEALANSLNINKGLFKQAFGIEDKKLDDYDPYHTSDSKNEEFWFSPGGGQIDGEAIQSEYDEDTNTFKRGLYSQYGFRQNDFWYEDPFIPSFELFFDQNSPFFAGSDNIDENSAPNCLKSFIQQYFSVDSIGYSTRFDLWNEFKNVFFKIFEKDLRENKNRNLTNKAYYISKIAGLENIKNKMINYTGNSEGDKITITINEDVSMIAWYLSELYNNIIYSYKNQRYMFPENLIRFNMTIKINDVRNFTIPQSNNPSPTSTPTNKNNLGGEVKNVISPKSQIVYTLHDCTFDFFKSQNHDSEIAIGGYDGVNYAPKSLSFDIYYKSVTRWSEFPLLYPNGSMTINPWEPNFYTSGKQEYYNDLDRIKSVPPEKKGFTNQLLGKAAQTVVNQGLNYMDNLEAKLRDVRGSTVNNLLNQFRSSTGLNKIEPDNVYTPDFNDRTSLTNFGRSVGAGLLNDLETATRNAANF